MRTLRPTLIVFCFLLGIGLVVFSSPKSHIPAETSPQISWSQPQPAEKGIIIPADSLSRRDSLMLLISQTRQKVRLQRMKIRLK